MRLTFAQTGKIAARLMDGYGAEDIALYLGIDPAHVRMQIRKFRAQGLLVNMAREARRRCEQDERKRREGLLD